MFAADALSDKNLSNSVKKKKMFFTNFKIKHTSFTDTVKIMPSKKSSLEKICSSLFPAKVLNAMILMSLS